MLDSARAAPTIFAPSRGFGPAVWARGGLRLAEVLPVLISVAINAKRFAVTHLVAEARMVRKGFDVMSMELYARCTTFLTRVIVALEYLFAPFSEFPTVAGTLIVKRDAPLPARGVFASHVLLCAMTGAIGSGFTVVGKCVAAVFASMRDRFGSVCPAFLRAKAGGVSAVLFALVPIPTYLANQSYAILLGGWFREVTFTGAVLGALAVRFKKITAPLAFAAVKGFLGLGGALLRTVLGLLPPWAERLPALLTGFGDIEASRHRVNTRRWNCYVSLDAAYCAVILERCSEAGVECELISS